MLMLVPSWEQICRMEGHEEGQEGAARPTMEGAARPTMEGAAQPTMEGAARPTMEGPTACMLCAPGPPRIRCGPLCPPHTPTMPIYTRTIPNSPPPCLMQRHTAPMPHAAPCCALSHIPNRHQGMRACVPGHAYQGMVGHLSQCAPLREQLILHRPGSGEQQSAAMGACRGACRGETGCGHVPIAQRQVTEAVCGATLRGTVPGVHVGEFRGVYAGGSRDCLLCTRGATSMDGAQFVKHSES